MVVWGLGGETTNAGAWCLTSTETLKLIRDGEGTLVVVECCFTFTETVGFLGTGAQDGHLDFHTAPEL